MTKYIIVYTIKIVGLFEIYGYNNGNFRFFSVFPSLSFPSSTFIFFYYVYAYVIMFINKYALSSHEIIGENKLHGINRK